MSCPLCNNKVFGDSWFGSTKFNDRVFKYVECSSCKSLYTQPMPDADTLKKMYGQHYFKSEDKDCVLSHDSDNRFAKPVEWLKKRSPSVLLDYGCGAGELLEQAKKLGWECNGLEFDEGVAKNVEKRLNVRVVNNVADLGENFKAGVLHLGDVVEHLTDLNNQMPEILKLLGNDGTLLVQGPLEANANLFTFLLKYKRKLRGIPDSNMPPYHVLLATGKGQREFFKRLGLIEKEFVVTETEHPAPSNIFASDLFNPKKVGLFTARRISQLFTKMFNKNWGNRFFYVGEKSDDIIETNLRQSTE